MKSRLKPNIVHVVGMIMVLQCTKTTSVSQHLWLVVGLLITSIGAALIGNTNKIK